MTSAEEQAAMLVSDAVTHKLVQFREVLKAYEQWEADLIMCNEAWRGTTPRITQDLWDRLLEIQTMHIAALKEERLDDLPHHSLGDDKNER